MPESSELSLLQIALSAAVPMRIAELRRRPLAEILDPEALRSIQARLAEAREEVLYGGTSGASGFNALADAVARLAFLPGGIYILGMHFDAARTIVWHSSSGRPSGSAGSPEQSDGGFSQQAGRSEPLRSGRAREAGR